MVNDLNFFQAWWATAGASSGDKCVQHAVGPGEMKGDPCAEGLDPLGEPGKGTELDGNQKDTTT